MSAAKIRAEIDALGDPVRAAGSARFFKTGPGEYGEGDVFAGVSVPVLRRVVRSWRSLPLAEASELLTSPVHEHRLAAVLLMVDAYTQAERAGAADRCEAVYTAYLAGRAHVNNWDLVDASSEFIVGPQVRSMGSRGRRVLDQLVGAESLWDRRIGVLATFHDIKMKDSGPTLRVCARLLDDREDLIHKATGWMLREVGKRVSLGDLVAFLDEYAAVMPRTMLRYSIEHFDPGLRRHYLDAR